MYKTEVYVLLVVFGCVKANYWIRQPQVTRGQGSNQLSATASTPDSTEVYATALLAHLQPGFVTEVLESYDRMCRRRGFTLDLRQTKRQVEVCSETYVREFVDVLTSFPDKERQMTKFALYKITNGITEFVSLSPREAHALKAQLVTPLCTFLDQFVSCITPQDEDDVAECISEVDRKGIEYVNQALKSTCASDGMRIVEFLGSGGFGCMEHYNQEWAECHRLELTDVQTMDQLCRILYVEHACARQMIKACPDPRPSAILTTVLKEVDKWTNETCAQQFLNWPNAGANLDHNLMLLFMSFLFLI